MATYLPGPAPGHRTCEQSPSVSGPGRQVTGSDRSSGHYSSESRTSPPHVFTCSDWVKNELDGPTKLGQPWGVDLVGVRCGRGGRERVSSLKTPASTRPPGIGTPQTRKPYGRNQRSLVPKLLDPNWEDPEVRFGVGVVEAPTPVHVSVAPSVRTGPSGQTLTPSSVPPNSG